NRKKIIKAIQLIEISYFPCSVHTLYFSILKGFNAAKAFKKYITNLILYFNGSSKQTENLKDTQHKLNYLTVYEVFLDVITR
ncbi:9818_t:CDS:1, partial [Scutellospora calospora]